MGHLRVPCRAVEVHLALAGALFAVPLLFVVSLIEELRTASALQVDSAHA